MSDDDVLFEARPRGYVRPGCLELACYSSIALLGTMMLINVVQAATMPTVTWSWNWGVITVTGTAPPGSQMLTSITVSGPNPLTWVLLIVALDAFRWADVRSHVFRVRRGAGLEVERGFVWRGRTVYAVAGDEAVEVAPRGAIVRLAGKKPLHLLGLDAQDAAALQVALRRLHAGE